MTIEISEAGGIRYLHFGSPWVQGAMRIARPWKLELVYTRAMMASLLLHPNPRRALLVGLGAGSLAKFLHRWYPRTVITVVEVDPAVERAARQFFALPADPGRLRVIIADGVDYLAATQERFDLMLVDGYDAGASPGGLESLAFYRHCRQRLTRDGVLAANLFSADRRASRAAARLAQAFSGQTRSMDPCEGGNRIVFGLAAPRRRLGRAALLRRAAALAALTGMDLDYAVPHLLPEPQAPR